jgi:SAM-dependent methyltransferase
VSIKDGDTPRTPTLRPPGSCSRPRALQALQHLADHRPFFPACGVRSFAYSGIDARKTIHQTEFAAGEEVVDLCCGVGFSSARTGRVTAVDMSSEMLTIARLRRPDIRNFAVGNAESWGEVRARARARASRTPLLLHSSASGIPSPSPSPHPLPLPPPSSAQTRSCDVATVMFGMHEMPGDARRRVIRNALRLARRKVLVVDIWPGFEPSPMMLSGEPFLLDYLANIENDVKVRARTARPCSQGRASLFLSYPPPPSRAMPSRPRCHWRRRIPPLAPLLLFLCVHRPASTL